MGRILNLGDDGLLEEDGVDEEEAGDAAPERVRLEAVGEGGRQQLLRELVQFPEGLWKWGNFVTFWYFRHSV